MTFLQVEHHFYIPRLSQNWIIGTRLVKGTDMNKSLSDFDIRGSGVGGGGVSVFMYVMHTKKAQVPNEAARVRQQHVQHRQQQQQSTQVVYTHNNNNNTVEPRLADTPQWWTPAI